MPESSDRHCTAPGSSNSRKRKADQVAVGVSTAIGAAGGGIYAYNAQFAAIFVFASACTGGIAGFALCLGLIALLDARESEREERSRNNERRLDAADNHRNRIEVAVNDANRRLNDVVRPAPSRNNSENRTTASGCNSSFLNANNNRRRSGNDEDNHGMPDAKRRRFLSASPR